MFARVQTFHQPADQLEELTHFARQQVVASSPPGLRDFYYLIDRDNEKALLISVWETEADLRRLEATNASTRTRARRETGVETPPAEIFEVALRRA